MNGLAAAVLMVLSANAPAAFTYQQYAVPLRCLSLS